MNLDIITIGTASRDAFLKSEVFKTVSSPEFISGEALCMPAGAKINISDIVFSTGGGATNAAVTFARQGFHAATICKVGDDVSGKEIINNLKAEGVGTHLILQDEKLKTAYAVIILSGQGERTVLVFRGASDSFEASDINLRLLQAKWIYIAGALPVEILKLILSYAHKNNIKVAMNPSASQIKLGLNGLGEIIKQLSVLIMNREEGALLTGIKYGNERDIFKKLDDYVRGVVVLTDGAKGVLVSDGQKMYQAGIYKEKSVVDRTGAGDAFGSGLVASLIADPNNIERAIKLASANATSVVESVGAKTGILAKAGFENEARWRDLRISTKDLL